MLAMPYGVPTKEMWKRCEALLTKPTFRVVDVEKITIPKDPTPEQEYWGMLFARHITSSYKLARKIEWDSKDKVFRNLLDLGNGS